MTALAAPRVQSDRLGNESVISLWRLPMKAATKVYQGGLVVVDAGYAAPGRTALGLLAAGRAESTVDNTGAAGVLEVVVRRGTFPWVNSATVDAIAQADVGKLCYIVDDQTVALTDAGGTRSPAGRIMQLEAGLVWVEVGVGAGADAAGFEEAGEVRTVLTFPINLASIADGQVIGNVIPGFAGRIIKTQFVVNAPATTAAKATTLTPRIGTTAVTGGVLALTSANCTPMGAVVAGTAVTALNTFTAAQAINVQASATTAFVEGSGTLLISLG